MSIGYKRVSMLELTKIYPINLLWSEASRS